MRRPIAVTRPRPVLVLGLGLALGLGLLVAEATATTVRLATVRGAPRSGLLVGLTPEGVRIESAGREVTTVPLAEIVGMDVEPPEAGSVITLPPPAEEDADRTVAIRLAGGDRLVGVLAGGSEDAIRVKNALLGEIRLALDAVREIRFDAGGDDAARSRREGDKDSLTCRGGDTFTGWIASFDSDSLRIDCVVRDDYRIPFSRLAAVHLFHESEKPPQGLLTQIGLLDGSRITGRDPVLEGEHLRIRSAIPGGGDAVWSIRMDAVRHLTVLNGSFVHVSDVPDLGIEVVPYFPPADPMLDPSEWLAPRRDRAFPGTPLRLGGRIVHKGLGVVSGTTVTVDLTGAYRAFRATVGIDEAAGPRGSVTFEVIVDGKIRFRSPLLRTGAPPVVLPPVDVTGAKTLGLRVTYGDEAGADVQDVADWGEPILVK